MDSLWRRFGGADPARTILLAPLIFALHVAEEAPGFVGWFNSLVGRGITQQLFLTVNAAAFVITLFVVAPLALMRERGAALVALGWLGFLMFANALFHITATLVHSRYSPGTLTAAALYLPYFSWFLWSAARRFKLGPAVVAATVLLCSLPMLAHGYLIIFEGSRLF